MAPVLRQAIIATEDADFEQHFGLSISRILITAIRDVLTASATAPARSPSSWRGRCSSPSTCRAACSPGRADGLERKVKEILVAIQLEKRYTKREILDVLRQPDQPRSRRVRRRSRRRAMYFGKSAKDLNLEEAAAIAAIIQTPARLSPFVNPDRTLARRNTTCCRGWSTKGSSPQSGRAKPRRSPTGAASASPSPERSIAPYFAEEIRKKLEEKYGADATVPSGSARADDARRRAAGGGERRRRSRPAADRQAARRLPEAGAQRHRRGPARLEAFTLDAVDAADPRRRHRPGRRDRSSASGGARVRIGGARGSSCRRRRSPGRGRPPPADLFTVGDLIEVEVRALTGRRARAI